MNELIFESMPRLKQPSTKRTITSKQEERDELERQMREFEQSGGEIKEIDYGLTTESILALTERQKKTKI